MGPTHEQGTHASTGPLIEISGKCGTCRGGYVRGLWASTGPLIEISGKPAPQPHNMDQYLVASTGPLIEISGKSVLMIATDGIFTSRLQRGR